MDANQLLKSKRKEILQIAARNGATNVRVFGSVARGEAGFKDVEIKKSVTYDTIKGDGYGVGSITVEAHKR